MKYGFSYNRYTKNQQLFGEPAGNFSFGTLSGDSMMDMVLGLASNYDQASGSSRPPLRKSDNIFLCDG